VFIPTGLYHFSRHQLTYGSALDRRFTYNFFERFGSYYDGTLNELRVRANYRPTPKFSGCSARQEITPARRGHDFVRTRTILIGSRAPQRLRDALEALRIALHIGSHERNRRTNEVGRAVYHVYLAAETNRSSRRAKASTRYHRPLTNWLCRIPPNKPALLTRPRRHYDHSKPEHRCRGAFDKGV
jgi:hypothetical protein